MRIVIAGAGEVGRHLAKLIAIDGDGLRELCEQDHGLGHRMQLCITKLLAGHLEGTRVQVVTVD